MQICRLTEQKPCFCAALPVGSTSADCEGADGEAEDQDENEDDDDDNNIVSSEIRPNIIIVD
jgi:hypothetical protein